MRLLCCDVSGEIEFTRDLNETQLPPYAILSHTWAADPDEEVTYDDVQGRTAKMKHSAKLEFCARQTMEDGLRHFWVDTCCINKSDSAEVSEAITSMFRWYSKAEKCYAYLSDVSGIANLRRSRWFTRGWTLQELLAPRVVEFFDKSGALLGTRLDLADLISEVTSIPVEVLRSQSWSDHSVDARMAWQRGRSTSKEEDTMYSLMGLLDVSIPVQYGEGFERAQNKLLRALQSEWLDRINPWQDHTSARLRRTPHTGEWLLKDARYERWKTGANRCLWLHGKPGSGKTILCTSVVDDLRAHCEKLEATVLFFYFSISDDRKRSRDDLCQSLMVQLRRVPVVSRGRTSVDEILPLLKHNPIFLVLDAVDECPAEDDARQMVLNMVETVVAAVPTLRLLLTSRGLYEIGLSMEALGSEHIDLSDRCVDADIRIYLASQFASDRRLLSLNARTKSMVQSMIVERSGGMFAYAYQKLQQVKRIKSHRPSRILTMLREMPETLNDMYGHIVDSITPVARKDALLLLQWVVYAKRPLTLQELVEAAIIDDETDLVDVADRGPVEDAMRLLSSLVTIVKDESLDQTDDVPRISLRPTDKVQLSHYTVKEYFESQEYLRQDHAHHLLAQRCIKYLKHHSMEGAKDIEYPLLVYAAQSWPYHAARHSHDIAMELEFLLDEVVFKCWLQIHRPDTPWMRPIHCGSIGAALYQVSYLGLPRLVEELLEQGADINARGGRLYTALQAAAHEGHVQVVKSLLHRGADDLCDALHHASRNGHSEVVKLLLDRGASLTTDHENMTALHYAVWASNSEMVDIFLQAGMSLDIAVRRKVWRGDDTQWTACEVKDVPTGYGNGLTPLHYAVLTGNVSMTKYLIEKGADVNARSEYGETPLHLAVKRDLHGLPWCPGIEDYWNDSRHTPEALLEFLADETDDEDEWATALDRIEQTRAEIVGELCRHGADVSAQDYQEASPLHCVNYSGRQSVEVVKLLHHGAVSQRDSQGRTALHLACSRGDLENVRRLLRFSIDDTDKEGTSALLYAARSGDPETIQLVLELAGEASLRHVDRHGQNALHQLLGSHRCSKRCVERCSQRSSHRFVDLDAVKPLVEAEVDLNLMDRDGYTPIALCLREFLDRSSRKAKVVAYLFEMGADATWTSGDATLGHVATHADEVGAELLEVLFENGVDLRATDVEGRTILHHLALHGSLEEREALDFLCDVGVSCAAEDLYGKTAMELLVVEKRKKRSKLLFRSDRWATMERLLVARHDETSRTV